MCKSWCGMDGWGLLVGVEGALCQKKKTPKIRRGREASGREKRKREEGIMFGRHLARRKLNALGSDIAAYVGLKHSSNGTFFRTFGLSSSSSPREALARFYPSSSSVLILSLQQRDKKVISSTSGANFSTSSQVAEPAASNQKRVLGEVRNDWTKEEIREMYSRPLLELVFDAATVHRMHHDPKQVQQCTLLSIKTGGCPETCNYCAQSSSWKKETELKAEKLMQIDDVYEAAKRAKAAGSTRFCMGTAWRGPSQVGEGQFERVLTMTKQVKDLGMEVCATLGMLTPNQAVKLREAGLTAYNHNLDTSPEYYPKVTSSRKYEDRLNTIAAVRDAGISVCCGGILGLGEEEADRASLMHVLASLPEHPESVPINALVPVKGTPFENLSSPSGLEMVRAIAVARILMPRTVVRLSAGRINMSDETQAMCFLAGANSVFTGDKLLTTPNNDDNEDSALFKELGLEGRPAFVPYGAGGKSSDGSEWEINGKKQEQNVA